MKSRCGAGGVAERADSPRTASPGRMNAGGFRVVVQFEKRCHLDGNRCLATTVTRPKNATMEVVARAISTASSKWKSPLTVPDLQIILSTLRVHQMFIPKTKPNKTNLNNSLAPHSHLKANSTNLPFEKASPSLTAKSSTLPDSSGRLIGFG